MAAALCLGACEGRIGSGHNQGAGTLGEALEGCLPNQAWFPSIRRLSEVEWLNTVVDLFPDHEIDRGELAALLADDNRVHGFENNVHVLGPSVALVDGQIRAAAALAASLTGNAARREALTGCSDFANDYDEGEAACVETFLQGLLRRVFRRPVSDDEVGTLVELHASLRAEGLAYRDAINRLMQAILQDPEFVYLIHGGHPGSNDREQQAVILDDWQLASRLSYLLWQSIPDDELFAAAEAGALSSEAGLLAQAERMLADAKATATLSDFARQWLEINELAAVNGKEERFRQHDYSYAARRNNATEDHQQPIPTAPQLIDDAKRFLYETMAREPSYAALFHSPATWSVGLSAASVYGVSIDIDPETYAPRDPSDPNDFARRHAIMLEATFEIAIPPNQRAGVFTLPAFQAIHAHNTNPSPPLRGVAVLDKLWCHTYPPPPPDLITELAPPADNGPETNRERFERTVDNPACAACHTSIDGIGFAFEHYDQSGAFRSVETVGDTDLPIDASGQLPEGGPDFANALGLMEQLEHSPHARACYTRQWMRFALTREVSPSAACDAAVLRAMADRFETAGGSIPALLLALIERPEFRLAAPANPTAEDTP